VPVRRRRSERDRRGREHQDREDAGAHERGRVLGQHGPVAQPDLGQRDEDRQRGRRDQRRLHALPRGERAPVDQQGGQPADDEHQAEEQGSRPHPEYTKKIRMKKP
jgi:hypothetical protein